MSVIIRDEEGNLLLLCKGADRLEYTSPIEDRYHVDEFFSLLIHGYGQFFLPTAPYFLP